MEKLQKALQKARTAREQAAQTGGIAQRGPASTTPPRPSASTQPIADASGAVDPAPVAEPAALKNFGFSTSGRNRSRPLTESASPGLLSPWDALTPFEPNPDVLLKNRVMTLNAQVGPNPFDILRTKVFLLMQQNRWKRLAITSPTKGCGKTTVACNLTVGFSRQRDTPTMLFDVDLRRPSVAKSLGCKPTHGINALLRGEVSPQEQILRLRSNVALSMARGPTADPTQMLLAQNTSSIFQSIEDQYAPDLMIFDLPPMLVTDDARAFLKNVDCALIVARAEQTKTSQLDICEREVSEHTNVLGVVLNSCRHVSEEEEYYGEYS